MDKSARLQVTQSQARRHGAVKALEDLYVGAGEGDVQRLGELLEADVQAGQDNVVRLSFTLDWKHAIASPVIATRCLLKVLGRRFKARCTECHIEDQAGDHATPTAGPSGAGERGLSPREPAARRV